MPCLGSEEVHQPKPRQTGVLQAHLQTPIVHIRAHQAEAVSPTVAHGQTNRTYGRITAAARKAT